MAILASDGARWANKLSRSLSDSAEHLGEANLSVSIVASERNPRERDDTSDYRIASLRETGDFRADWVGVFRQPDRREF
jgi:hypothetical protein